MEILFFMFIIEIIITVLCIIYIVLVTTKLFGSYEPPSSNESSKDPLVRIKNSMYSSIDPTYKEMAKEYLGKMETAFQDMFMENSYIPRTRRMVPRPKTGELSNFGIGLLSMYLLDNKKTEYLKIVEDLIVKINEQLNTLKKYTEPLLFIPWYSNWYYFSVTLNRMFAMYEYIGTNDEVKNICDRRILQITPTLDRSLSFKRDGVNLVYLAIPRLLTNYLYHRLVYDSEVKSDLFVNMDRQFQIIYNSDNEIKNGIYQDYSCICHTVIPNFAYLLTLGGFYINVYRALGFKEGISDVVKKILDKTIHQNLNFIGYGLFTRDPRITCNEILEKYWPDYQRSPDFDVNIFPFMGLGVFKSQNFILSLRVQREGMAAYEYSKWVQEYALGWIQMRKLYLVGVNYSSYNSEMLWKDLKIQPGVVSFAEDKDNKFDAFRTTNPNATLPKYCRNIKSYIGHLNGHKDRKLLYWFNKYEFGDFYGENVEISERGVCSDNGLVMRYEIKNQSGKALKLILKDADIGNKMKIKPSVDDSGTGVLIPDSGEPKIVQWYQVFDDTIEPKTVDGDSANNSMSFTINRDMYVIEQHGDYHIVKCNGDIILAGNSSSLRDASITHHDVSSGKDTVFKRDSKTLMYVPQ
uniref:uncharacterized LOC103574600 n=1 Tax=Microplitis demolitor TaxID=69319 RepID=UPI0031E33A30